MADGLLALATALSERLGQQVGVLADTPDLFDDEPLEFRAGTDGDGQTCQPRFWAFVQQ